MRNLTTQQSTTQIFLNSLNETWVIEVDNNNPHNYSIHQTNNQPDNLQIYNALNPGINSTDWERLNGDFKSFLSEVTGVNDLDIELYDEVDKIIKNNLK